MIKEFLILTVAGTSAISLGSQAVCFFGEPPRPFGELLFVIVLLGWFFLPFSKILCDFLFNLGIRVAKFFQKFITPDPD